MMKYERRCNLSMFHYTLIKKKIEERDLDFRKRLSQIFL